jgi:hypothetical protein
MAGNRKRLVLAGLDFCALGQISATGSSGACVGAPATSAGIASCSCVCLVFARYRRDGRGVWTRATVLPARSSGRATIPRRSSAIRTITHRSSANLTIAGEVYVDTYVTPESELLASLVVIAPLGVRVTRLPDR